MSFVLLAKYSENTPIPRDSSVSIKRIPAKTIAVIVFSGYSSEIDLPATAAKSLA
jgi:effector-binding domain-containing protein